jgi:hypothetical protein
MGRLETVMCESTAFGAWRSVTHVRGLELMSRKWALMSKVPKSAHGCGEGCFTSNMNMGEVGRMGRLSGAT